MAIDPAAMMGLAPPQGLTNTQQGMPPQEGPPPPSQGGGMPMSPVQMPQGEVVPGAPGVPAPEGEPPKPPSLIPTHLARTLAEAINATKMEHAKNLTEYLGDPRGSVGAKPSDLLRAWRRRNPDVDPLYEKIVNKVSDDDIMNMMYPLRRPMIKYGRRTYTEQVQFAEYMAKLDADEKYASLDEADDEDDEYEPPASEFPSLGEERDEDDDILEPEDEEEE